MWRLVLFCSLSLFGLGGSVVEATPTSRPSILVKPSTRPQVAHSFPAKQLQHLFARLKHAKWRPRYDATQAIAALGKKKGWRVFGRDADRVFKRLRQAMMTDKDFWVRAGAAKAFGILGGRGVLDLLLLIDKDKQSEVRHAAIKAIENIGVRGHNKVFLEGHSTKVMAMLNRMLKISSVQFTAARAIEKLTGNALPLVELSIRSLCGKNNLIRGLVARSFRKLSPQARVYAIPRLIKAFEHSTSDNFEDIVNALVVLGKGTIPALRKAKRHPNEMVRQGATSVLRRLTKSK